MAVPKKKKSHSRTMQGRSHEALKRVNVVVDKDTGEYRLPHRMDTSNNSYNNRQVLVAKDKSEPEDE